MKTTAPQQISEKALLKGISEGKFYTSSIVRLSKLGYVEMKVDVDAAPFNIEKRYIAQTCTIPANKRGNLKQFAGQKVRVICTTLARTGARIEFFIKSLN